MNYRSGRKWLITGFDGAPFMILMARTVVNGADAGATMFLVDLPTSAVQCVPSIDSMDSSFTGGHAELDIQGLVVSADDVLGEIGKGFRYAQVRLAPARLTHCMRWLGAARRAQDISLDYSRRHLPNDQQMFELITVIAAYNMVSRVLVATGIRPEDH